MGRVPGDPQFDCMGVYLLSQAELGLHSDASKAVYLRLPEGLSVTQFLANTKSTTPDFQQESTKVMYYNNAYSQWVISYQIGSLPFDMVVRCLLFMIISVIHAF